jgi:hypothetical protein
MKSAKTAAPTRGRCRSRARDLALQLERGELELEPRDRARVLGDLLRRGADAAVGRACQSRGWAWPLQSIHFASTMPATSARRRRGTGSGRRRFASLRLRALPELRAEGARRLRPGFWFVGASPFARALIRLGFSLRRKSASSASGSASFALTPPSPAISFASCCSLSARARPSDRPCSFLRRGLLAGERRQMRDAPRRERSSRARRSRRTGRSRAACAASGDVLPARSCRQTCIRILRLCRRGRRSASADRERRLAQARRDAVRAARRARRAGCARDAGDDLARHPRARAREDARPARPAALRPAATGAAHDPREALDSVLGSSAAAVTAAQEHRRRPVELGSAPAIARALDRSSTKVVGTLAGDDTCLVVAPSDGASLARARELAERAREQGGAPVPASLRRFGVSGSGAGSRRATRSAAARRTRRAARPRPSSDRAAPALGDLGHLLRRHVAAGEAGRRDRRGR